MESVKECEMNSGRYYIDSGKLFDLSLLKKKPINNERTLLSYTIAPQTSIRVN